MPQADPAAREKRERRRALLTHVFSCVIVECTFPQASPSPEPPRRACQPPISRCPTLPPHSSSSFFTSTVFPLFDSSPLPHKPVPPFCRLLSCFVGHSVCTCNPLRVSAAKTFEPMEEEPTIVKHRIRLAKQLQWVRRLRVLT
eukprot:6177776-Pleurochrysis_carterae.AAC.2